MAGGHTPDLLTLYLPAVAGFLLLALGADAIVRVGLQTIAARRIGLGLAFSLALMTVGSVFPEVALIFQTHALERRIERGEIYYPLHPVEFSERSTEAIDNAVSPPQIKLRIDDSSLTDLRNRLIGRTTSSLPIGIVLGSCLINLLLVIGIAGLRFGKPIPTSSRALMRDGAFLALGALFAAIVVTKPSFLPSLKWEMLSSIGLGLAFIYVAVVMTTDGASATVAAAAAPGAAPKPEAGEPAPAMPRTPGGMPGYLYFFGGLIALWLGASLIIGFVADHMIWFENVAGADPKNPQVHHDVFAPLALLGLAVGVAIPELLAASIIARGDEPDLALSTVLSATVLNLLGGLGLAILLFSDNANLLAALPHFEFSIDLLALIIAIALVLYFLFSGRKLSSGESMLLILLYAAYVALRLPFTVGVDGTTVAAHVAQWLQHVIAPPLPPPVVAPS